MKTKLEILHETFDYYSDPSKRGYDSGACKYITKDGNTCAVGRCAKDPAKLEKLGGSVYNVNIDVGGLDTELKPEYLRHDIGFWRDLQRWHDNSLNFTDTEISEQGKLNSQHLLEKYAN